MVSASELVGLTTWECEQSLEGLGECMSIGPGGENGVKFASPLTAGRRAAGRGGSGAQFGYKHLKAITVIGSGTPRYAKPLELDVAIKKQRSEMGMRRRSGDPFYSFGTSRGPIYASATSRMPTANYTSTTGAITKMGTKEITSMLDTQKLSGENWHEQLPDAKQSGCCRPCPIACEAADRPSGVKGRPIHINRVDRPEYETLALLGSGPIGEAFIIAFSLPNIFRRFFAEGAFNAAFIPMFKKNNVGKFSSIVPVPLSTTEGSYKICLFW